MSDEEAGPLLELVLAAQQRYADYAETKTLIAAAERLVEYAVGTRATCLLAASPLAERVVGAAVVLAGGQLENTPLHNGDGRNEVLVVDVATATPFAAQAAARQLHPTHARTVRGVTLDPLGVEADFQVAGTIEIELLRV